MRWPIVVTLASGRRAVSQRSPPAVEDRYLKATALLDVGHPRLQALVTERSWRELPERARVGAVYDFVRDAILFGYNASDDIPASAVLADGYGQRNTKTTMLMALLRASGIGCRFHGATIDKRLQRGVMTGLRYWLAPSSIIHSWAEVFVDGSLGRARGRHPRRRLPRRDSEIHPLANVNQGRLDRAVPSR